MARHVAAPSQPRMLPPRTHATPARQNNTLFVSVPGILADDGMTRTELGSWFSAACIVAATVQPVFGRLHDRFGGRVCIPAALLALAVALLGLASARRPAGVFLSLIVRRSLGVALRCFARRAAG